MNESNNLDKNIYQSCLQKQDAVRALFSTCQSPEAKYAKIIELGRSLSPLKSEYKTETNRVQGCQSNMFLHVFQEGNELYYEAESDALISAGLAALLLRVYNGEPAEVILKCPPSYLDELGISTSLTPNRANGLYSIHLRMKQEALKFLMKKY